MTQPSQSAPGHRVALLGAVLFGTGMVGANTLVQLGAPGGALGAAAPAGSLRLAAVATAAAGLGVLLLTAAAATQMPAGWSRLTSTAAAGAAASALFLLAGLRYAAPELIAPSTEGSGMAAATTACAFAAFVALGSALLVSPGPPGAVQGLGRAAGACCAAGPLLASLVALADEGASHGLAVASTALGVLLVTGWGLGLAVALRSAQPAP